MQLDVTRHRIALYERLQIGNRLCRGSSRCNLRLEQRRHFPIRAEFERAAGFSQRAFLHRRGTGSLSNRVVRLGNTEERTAHLLNQVEHRDPILVPHKHAVEPEEIRSKPLLVGLSSIRTSVGASSSILLDRMSIPVSICCARRAGFSVKPQLRRLKRDIVATGIARDFNGPFEHARIAGTQ